MERVVVVPSNLYSVGYDPERRILEVQFISGSIFQYYDVPFDRYEGLLIAGFKSRASMGNYFDSVIRHAFQFTAIGYQPIKTNDESDLEKEVIY